MDLDPSLAHRVGTELGTEWTSDYDGVLSDEHVHAVFICSPHDVHADQAIRAIRAGKHVIVEKPLARTLTEAEEVVRAAREKGVALTTWLGYRYEPEVVRAKELLAAGAVGQVLGAHLAYHRQKPVHYADAGGGWRGRWETAGGGVLIMTGIHYLDWLLYLTGLKVSEVSAQFDTLQSDDNVENAIVFWLRLENGALATVNIASCVQGFYRQDHPLVECRLWGEDGHISLTPPAQFYSSRVVDGRLPERWYPLTPLPRLRHRDVEFLDRFSVAVLEERRPEITDEDGLRVQAVIEAAYRSAREASPVTVVYPDLTLAAP